MKKNDKYCMLSFSILEVYMNVVLWKEHISLFCQVCEIQM